MNTDKITIPISYMIIIAIIFDLFMYHSGRYTALTSTIVMVILIILMFSVIFTLQKLEARQ